MNKRQLEVEKKKLAEEALELKHLKAIYNKAAEDIAKNISITDGKVEVLLANWDDLSDDDKSVYQSKIYQRNYQKQLQKQINDVLKDLNSGQYKSINEYLEKCYKTGFIGSMYDIAGQGIPIIAPIDQKKVIRAMKTNSKISKGLYTKLGEDVDFLKKRIANNISRGIATADSYENIARNISNASNVGFNKSMRIARTEGHRIHSNSAHDAQLAAKEAGADIVKQWNSTLDGKTRPHHRQLDGQLREVEEPFEMGGMKAMYPSDFGRPEEDINCRCALMQRAKWALDDDELETLKKRAEYFGLDKTDSFNDFRQKYLKASTKDETLTNRRQQRLAARRTARQTTKIPDFNSMEHEDILKWADSNLQTSFEGVKGANKEFVKEAVSTLAEFESKMGGTIDGLSVKFGGLSGNVFAKYDDKTKTLLLKKTGSRKAFEDSLKKDNARYRAKWKNDKDYHATDTFRGTIFHELGHAVDIDTGQSLSRQLGASNELYEKSVKVSAYAGTQQGVRVTKASEAWAENFAAYMAGGANAKKVPAEVKEMIEDYFKKSTKAGKGLGAKIGGEGLIPLHEEPALLKTIDYGKKKVVQNELKDFEKNAITESVETACVVTANGEVYKCFGVEDRVFPDYDLGDKLKGASVSHNHPIDETVFSFSKDDLQLFMEYDLDVLRGCDEKYTYEFTRNPAEIDEPMEDWMNFENYNHVDIIRLAKEYGIGYRRWKNE